MAVLHNREARALMLSFGVYDGRKRTLAETGACMGVTGERVRQILGHAADRIGAGTSDGRRVIPFGETWRPIERFADIEARPLMTAEWLAGNMGAAKDDVRQHRLDEARLEAFCAIWRARHPSLDPALDIDGVQDDDDGPDIAASRETAAAERQVALDAFSLPDAQQDLVDLEVSRAEAVSHVQAGCERLVPPAGVAGTAVAWAFECRRRPKPMYPRDAVSVVVPDSEADAFSAAKTALVDEVAAGDPVFAEFLAFLRENSARYGFPRGFLGAGGAGVAIAWAAIDGQGGQVRLDAAAFRARRDAMAGRFGRYIIGEIIWADFGTWAPSADLVTAVAEFLSLRADTGRYAALQHRLLRRQRAAARYARGIAAARAGA
jgi:hypothetical protein